jgi:hypothetical protein
MNRRHFLTDSILAAATLASRSASLEATSAAAGTAELSLTVRTAERPNAIAPDFMGLGYEIASVARRGLMSGKNKGYVQLVRTLGPRGVIRIGGNTADFAAYSPKATPVSSPFGTIVNDAVLKDLGEFLKSTGWSLIWTLNLGKGSEAEAIAEAKAVLAAVGPRLLAFEIGNEPDLFVSAKHRKQEYGYDEWLAEYRRYKAMLRAQFPRIPFAGPDVAGKTDWVTRFAADEGKDLAILTHHYYREGQNPTSTVEKLLGVDPKLQPQLDTLDVASRSCNVRYRICEVNSFSGGGRPGVSDTMAGALWVLDYMFTLALNGCSGVNMETGVNHRNFISSYSPIGDDEQGHYSAKPEYYGMLAFSLVGKGSMLRAEMDNRSADLRAYATRPRQGAVDLTVINKGSTPSVLTINIGDVTKSGTASVLRLMAPAVDAKTGITLGGSEVTAAGVWKPWKREVTAVHEGQFPLELPAASAAIVQLSEGS